MHEVHSRLYHYEHAVSERHRDSEKGSAFGTSRNSAPPRASDKNGNLGSRHRLANFVNNKRNLHQVYIEGDFGGPDGVLINPNQQFFPAP